MLQANLGKYIPAIAKERNIEVHTGSVITEREFALSTNETNYINVFTIDNWVASYFYLLRLSSHFNSEL